jgi:uncharacterized membrane protein
MRAGHDQGMRPLLFLCACLLAAAEPSPSPAPTVAAVPLPNPTAERFFHERILPPLQRDCFACHAGRQRNGGIQLDTPQAWAAGGWEGPLIQPGDPDAKGTTLMRALEWHDGEDGMPPKGKWPDAVIADFRRWIELGAPWPTAVAMALPPAPPAPPPLFGRLHPAIVHLPIAALALALVAEVLAALRLGAWWTPASAFLLIAGTAGGIAAALSGGALEELRPHHLLERHELLGWLTVVAGALALGLLVASKWLPPARWTMRALLAIGVVLAAWTGHLGGEMVHGPLF